MHWEVKSVKSLDNYMLFLTFKNNEQRYYDLKPLLNTGVFKSLKDPAMFNSVRVCFDSISWANHVDIAPETLYMDSVKTENNSFI